MTKQYVFDLLVNNLDDHIGLFAYSIYKYKKAELARSMRAAGRSEAEIDAATEGHHDNVSANNHQREKFRSQSEQFFSLYEDQIISEISQHYETDRIDADASHASEIINIHASCQKQISTLTRQYEAKIKRLERTHKKALDKKIKDEQEIRADWLRKVEAQKTNELGKGKIFGLWLLSGIPGAIATILLTVVVMSLVLMSKTTPEQKRFYMEKAAEDVVDTFAPKVEKPGDEK